MVKYSLSHLTKEPPMRRKITDQEVAIVQKTLEDYYHISVDEKFARKIVEPSTQLCKELANGSLRDTAARDVLINRFTQVSNLPPWPCNGDSLAYVKDFLTKFKQSQEKVGYKITFQL